MSRERLTLLAVLVAASIIAAFLVLPSPRREVEVPIVQRATRPSPPSREARPVPSLEAVDAGSFVEPAMPDYVQVDPGSAAACSASMVLVDGVYCPFVGHRCTRYLDQARDICATFAPDVLCEGRLQHRRFCIDTFEYPNLLGVTPAVMADWDDARRACAVESKRLCTVEEWEFACEGPQMWPYPYGTEREPLACNIDRTSTPSRGEALSDPWRVSEEIGRLDQRVPSGALPRCISPFGVHDMTGNVDEWVDNPAGKAGGAPFRSTLKGGGPGRGRARCRPMTSVHGEDYRHPDVGFRCCRDAQGGGAMELASPSAHIPKLGRMAAPPVKASR